MLGYTLVSHSVQTSDQITNVRVLFVQAFSPASWHPERVFFLKAIGSLCSPPPLSLLEVIFAATSLVGHHHLEISVHFSTAFSMCAAIICFVYTTVETWF